MKEAVDLPVLPMRAGPHADLFQDAIREVQHRMARLPVPADAWMGEAYMSPASMHFMTREAGFELRSEVYKVLEYRKVHFAGIGRTALAPLMSQTPLRHNVLAQPPYHHQAEELDIPTSRAQQICTQTTFRMVFEGITGCALHQQELFDATMRVFGSHIVEDDQLLRIFKTPTFTDRFKKSVGLAYIFGADFGRINEYVAAIASKRPVKPYVIASIGNRHVPHITHSVVLLNSDEQRVMVHDPSFNETSRRNAGYVSLDEFAPRWALAYNRALMVLDMTPPSRG